MRHHASHISQVVKAPLCAGVMALACIMFGSLVSSPVQAGWIADTFTAMDGILEVADVYTTAMREDETSVVRKFTLMFLRLFIMLIFIKEVMNYMMGSPNYVQILEKIFFVGMVLVIYDSYEIWTSGLYHLGNEIGLSIQEAAIQTRSPTGGIDIIVRATQDPDTQIGGFAGLVVYLILGIAGIISTFIAAWATFGFAILKLFGWMLVPFLLFDSLSSLFDNWLKRLWSYVVLLIVVRATISFAAVAIGASMGVFNFDADQPGLAQTQVEITADEIVSLSTADFPQHEMPTSESPAANPIAGLMAFILSISAMVLAPSVASSLVGGVAGFGGAVNTAKGAAKKAGGAAKGAGGAMRNASTLATAGVGKVAGMLKGK